MDYGLRQTTGTYYSTRQNAFCYLGNACYSIRCNTNIDKTNDCLIEEKLKFFYDNNHINNFMEIYFIEKYNVISYNKIMLDDIIIYFNDDRGYSFKKIKSILLDFFVDLEKYINENDLWEEDNEQSTENIFKVSKS